jgi:hypothetical protein
MLPRHAGDRVRGQRRETCRTRRLGFCRHLLTSVDSILGGIVDRRRGDRRLRVVVFGRALTSRADSEKKDTVRFLSQKERGGGTRIKPRPATGLRGGAVRRTTNGKEVLQARERLGFSAWLISRETSDIALSPHRSDFDASIGCLPLPLGTWIGWTSNST